MPRFFESAAAVIRFFTHDRSMLALCCCLRPMLKTYQQQDTNKMSGNVSDAASVV